MKALGLGVLLLLFAQPAAAQPVRGDGLVPAWPGHQRTAEVVSTATVAAALALDTVASWQEPVANRRHAFVMQGVREGVVFGSAWLVKRAVHRTRPCAPACGIDSASSSFYSLHTAFAASSIGGPRLVFTIPLTTSTGYLRIAAGKHYLTDTIVGALVGAAAGRWLR